MIFRNKMKILIVGDSWGRGEWNLECSQVCHTGLQQYLENHGHNVTNISNGGISNLDIVNRLSNYFQRYHNEKPDLILAFQTEYSRDYKHDAMQEDFGSNDWVKLDRAQDLVSKWIERFYFRLSELSTRVEVPIKIIGGCSDTVYFDDMNLDYPGCDIVCQSMTNLILTGNHRIEKPVFSWYTKQTDVLVKRLHEILPTQTVSDFLDEVDQGFQRECLIRENPEFFYPDGIHPNRRGHQILFDFLKSKNIF